MSALADLLDRRRTAIVDEFVERVRGTIAAESVDRPRLEDSLEQYLGELARRIRAEKAQAEGSSPAMEPNPTAAEHGGQRFSLGYDIGGVIREYGTLRDLIMEEMEKDGGHFPIADYRAFSKHLIGSIADAATRYASVRDEENRRQTARHLSFLAHELRNPLSSAVTAFEVLTRRGECQPTASARSLSRALARMSELIDETLLQHRLRDGPEVSLERIELQPFLAQIADESATEISMKRQTLAIEAGDLSLDADPRLLRSALGNLLRNAVKFSRDGGTITLRGKSGQGRVLIEVEDACGGLPAGMVQKLFDPFVQAGKDRSGFGLGLAIAKQAVEAHHGALRVHDLPGKGCVFVLDLPGLT